MKNRLKIVSIVGALSIMASTLSQPIVAYAESNADLTEFVEPSFEGELIDHSELFEKIDDSEEIQGSATFFPVADEFRVHIEDQEELQVISAIDWIGEQVQLTNKIVLDDIEWYLIKLDDVTTAWVEASELEEISLEDDVSDIDAEPKNDETEELEEEQIVSDSDDTENTSEEIVSEETISEDTDKEESDSEILDSKKVEVDDLEEEPTDEEQPTEETEEEPRMELFSLKTSSSSYIESFTSTIIASNRSIDSLPWGQPGSVNRGSTKDYLFQRVTITARSADGSYVLVTQKGRELGWIDVRALSTEVRGTPSTIVSGGYTIDTLPWGTSGAQRVSRSEQHLYKEVEIVATDRTGSYKLAVVEGRELGWIDQRAFSSNFTSYTSTIIASNRSIDSKPWGTSGAVQIGSTRDYLNQRVTITAKSANNGYVLVTQKGKQIGWIDVRALSTEVSGSPATILRGGYTIDTLPWGTSGAQRVSRSENHLYQDVRIVATDRTNSYKLAVVNGRELGWIDQRAFSTSFNNYTSTIIASNRTIDSKPWGQPGAVRLGSTKNYLHQRVTIIGRSADNAYVLVSQKGKQLGWIDVRALSTEVSGGQSATIARGGYTIDTSPWGTSGAQRVSNTNSHLNKQVRLVATDRTNSYKLAVVNGRELGWIDTRALRTVPLIYIDPGHGGKFSGAHYNGVSEKTINLQTALKLESLLKSRGYETKMSRRNDREFNKSLSPDLAHRANEANAMNADIFISIHYNAHPTATFSGIETYVYNRKGSTNNPYANSTFRTQGSRDLANKLQSQLIKQTGAPNRGVKEANFHVIRETQMPAVLLELGFMDNPNDLRKITTSSYQQKLARGIADGIDWYFGN